MAQIWTCPPVGTAIDWSNPLTARLVTCLPINDVAGRTLNDVVGRNSAVLTYDAAWTASPSGPAINADGGVGHWAVIGSGNPPELAIGAGTPHTIACVFRVTGYSGLGCVPGLIVAQDLPFNKMAGLEVYDLAAGDGTAKLRCELYDGSAGASIQDTVDLMGPGWHSAAWTLDGSTMALYRDGILAGTTSYSLGTMDAAGTQWYLGARPDIYGGANVGTSYTGFTGDIALALIAGRAWSAAEVASWAGNPWQVFQSPQPWYLTEMPPPGGDPVFPYPISMAVP